SRVLNCTMTGAWMPLRHPGLQPGSVGRAGHSLAMPEFQTWVSPRQACPPSQCQHKIVDRSHYRLLVLANCVDQLRIEIEVGLHQLARRQRHPLGERDVHELRSPEQLEEAQGLRAGVLDE